MKTLSIEEYGQHNFFMPPFHLARNKRKDNQIIAKLFLDNILQLLLLKKFIFNLIHHIIFHYVSKTNNSTYC